MRAAIDIGTNSVRLLIGRVEGRQVKPMRKEVKVSRLGQGVDAQGRLAKKAVERTLTTVAQLASEIPPGVPVCVLATSAVRDARNGQQFAQQVKDKIGVPLTILSGADEARLSFQGAVLSLEELDLPEPLSVVDIGGGSTEIYTGLLNGNLLGGGSVQVGAVRMLERFITTHPLLSEEQRLMEQEIEQLLMPLVDKNLRFKPQSLIAVGGTATSLAALIQTLPKYSDEKVTGYRISLDNLVESYNNLGKLSLESRRQIPSLQSGREDVIVSGAAILVKVAELMGINEIFTSAWDLLYGALAFPVDGGE